MNAIILHGAPEKEAYYNPDLPSESNAHWLPWLQKELLIRDIPAVTPEIPFSYEPKWDFWTKEIERYDITQETILVGHSAGAGFWVRYLSEHKDLRVGKVVLVGPWLDPGKTLEEDFFGFEIDSELLSRTKGLVIFYAEDDSESVVSSVNLLKAQIKGCQMRHFPGYGHFKYDNLKTDRFPELRDEILTGED